MIQTMDVIVHQKSRRNPLHIHSTNSDEQGRAGWMKPGRKEWEVGRIRQRPRVPSSGCLLTGCSLSPLAVPAPLFLPPPPHLLPYSFPLLPSPHHAPCFDFGYERSFEEAITCSGDCAVLASPQVLGEPGEGLFRTGTVTQGESVWFFPGTRSQVPEQGRDKPESESSTHQAQ